MHNDCTSFISKSYTKFYGKRNNFRCIVAQNILPSIPRGFSREDF